MLDGSPTEEALMAFAKECAACGGRFEAKRDTAKFCSGRCRQRAHVAPEAPPARREGAPVVGLPKREADENGLLAVTVRTLDEANRTNTPMGQATLLIARLLDSGIQDTGSSIAALVRQYEASLSKALEGSQAVATPLERMKAQRERRSA